MESGEKNTLKYDNMQINGK